MAGEQALTHNVKTPGQLVRDAGTFHELVATTDDTTTSGNSGWLDVGFIHDCTAHVELGAMAGTIDLIIAQADDSSGTGEEIMHNFTQFGATDDNEEAKAYLCVNKRYVKATWTAAASGGTMSCQLRLPQDHYDTSYSSTSS